LPVFDELNYPQPSTIGSGFGSDATLGGILPGMTQYDWQLMMDLQPSGLCYFDFVYPWQITIDGQVDDWNTTQLVFSDITGDTEDKSAGVTGVDITDIYMAYDWECLYGAIKVFDDIGEGDYDFDIIMSYSPDDDSALHSIRFNISISSGSANCSLYYMDEDGGGWTWWQRIADSLESVAGVDAVEFKVPMSFLPGYLPGRYITVKSSGWNIDWTADDGEDNSTHIRIGDVGTIAGTVSFSDYSGAAIYVQAYTDPQDPDGSTVARTMITEPGPYTLDGIGLGWSGFVRAYTPIFGFDNPFELGCFDIQSAVPVFMSDNHVGNIDLALSLPIMLEHDVEQSGDIDAQLAEVDWFALEALEGGTYTIDLIRNTAEYACLELYGRDGKTAIWGTYYWDTQRINWVCPASGRYFVQVSNGYYQPSGGTYQIQMTTNMIKPIIGLSTMQIDIELLEGDSETVNLDVFNAGIDTLDWTISWDGSVNWIAAVTPTTGSSDSRQDTATVSITIDTASLAVGLYSTNLTITGTGDVDPVILHVSLEVYDRVDLEGFALLARYWRGADCTESMLCFGLEELTKLADDWLGKMSHPYLGMTLDFETGDFATPGWQLSGDASWQIVSDVVYESSFAAKSGSITHNQNCSISLTVDTTGYNKISFVRKVSSESSYDYLRFYIDGVETANWSGELDWTIVEYDITDGTHTFEWRYTKDGSVNAGSDCTWIDNIKIYNFIE